MKTARLRKVSVPSTSSRLRRRQTELDYSSSLLRRKPLHTLRELDRYVKTPCGVAVQPTRSMPSGVVTLFGAAV